MKVVTVFGIAIALSLGGCGSNRMAALQLPVDEFNAVGKSWRLLEAQGKYGAAGELLEEYAARHASGLAEDETVLLYFHAAHRKLESPTGSVSLVVGPDQRDPLK